MRVLAVCESPPTLDPRFGDGSTLISAQLLRRLPDDVTLDLVYFQDRPARPPDALLARCRSVIALPLAPRLAGWITTLPRAAKLRATNEARRTVATLSRQADVTYIHGLEAFPLARDVTGTLVVHEVDPWSLFWRERSRVVSGARRAYDVIQSRRAFALEKSVAAHASRYLVVSSSDADALGAKVGRTIDVLGNGVDHRRQVPSRIGGVEIDDDGEPGTIGFVGTLDYAPNVEAVRILVAQVLPAVRTQVHNARLFVAGRRPTPEILGFAGPNVQVVGDVADISSAYRRPAVLAYPGSFGRGKKNTVLEALAAGRPVVASASAARGIAGGDHIIVADGAQQMSDAVIRLLADERLRSEMRQAARHFCEALPSWDDVAVRFAQFLGVRDPEHASQDPAGGR